MLERDLRRLREGFDRRGQEPLSIALRIRSRRTGPTDRHRHLVLICYLVTSLEFD